MGIQTPPSPLDEIPGLEEVDDKKFLKTLEERRKEREPKERKQRAEDHEAAERIRNARLY